MAKAYQNDDVTCHTLQGLVSYQGSTPAARKGGQRGASGTRVCVCRCVGVCVCRCVEGVSLE